MMAIALALLAFVFAREPPRPEGESARAPSAFSPERAFEDLRVLASSPRRIGSAHHGVARDAIRKTLEALGLEVEVQATWSTHTSFVAYGMPARLGFVQNVVARLPRNAPPEGPERAADALLLSAHYDTRSMTPGASDDGVGVVTLLETARALVPLGARRRDVIFLFTDGEEVGLLGARAFVAEHRFADRVALAMNFEARGNAGGVRLFQTSEESGPLVREALRRAPFPHASSLAQSVYERMPNDTDLTPFLARGVAGLNFANVAGLTRYHGVTDTPAALDRRTLAHHVSYATALARTFTESESLPPRGPSASYFVVRGLSIVYPLSAAKPFALLALALAFAAALALGARRIARPLRTLEAIVLMSVQIAASALVAYGLARIFAAADARLSLVTVVATGVQDAMAAAFVFSALALALAGHAVLRLRFRACELALGALVPFAVSAYAVASALPGAAYLLTWPAVACALPWLVAAAPFRVPAWLVPALHAGACIVTFAILAPLSVDVRHAFGAFHAAPALGLLVATMGALLAANIEVIVARAPRVPPLAALAASIVAAMLALGLPKFTEAEPAPHTLFALYDHDAQAGLLASPDAPLDPWTQRALEPFAVRRLSDVFPFVVPSQGALAGAENRSDASAASNASEALDETTVPLAVRAFDFAPPPAPTWAYAAEPHAEPHEAPTDVLGTFTLPAGTELVALHTNDAVTALLVAGQAVPPLANGRYSAQIWGPPPALSIRATRARGAGRGERVELTVVTQSRGLPTELAPVLASRPRTLAPKPGTLPPWDELLEGDMTVAVRRFAL
jgi:hypothetical protein